MKKPIFGINGDATQDPIPKYMDITPELAQKWLTRNLPRNRRIKRKSVEKFKRVMAAGNWRLTHQGIGFGVSGDLVDGQNRLTAIVESGVTVRMMVTTGLSEHAIEAIDADLAIRNASDSRRIRGDAPESSSPKWIAIVRALASIDMEDFTAAIGVLELDDLEQEYADSLKWIKQFPDRRQFAAPVYGALCFAYPVNPVRVNSFAHQIFGLKGAACENTGPSAFLRWYANIKSRTGAQGKKEIVFKTLSAINAHIRGRPISRLILNESVLEWFKAQREGCLCSL